MITASSKEQQSSWSNDRDSPGRAVLPSGFWRPHLRLGSLAENALLSCQREVGVQEVLPGLGSAIRASPASHSPTCQHPTITAGQRPGLKAGGAPPQPPSLLPAGSVQEGKAQFECIILTVANTDFMIYLTPHPIAISPTVRHTVYAIHLSSQTCHMATQMTLHYSILWVFFFFLKALTLKLLSFFV